MSELIDKAKTALEAYQYDYATALAKIAEAEAAERQATALESIAASLTLAIGKRGIVYTANANAI